MNCLWFEKYRPKCLSDILLPAGDIKKARDWIRDFKARKEKTPNCLFIYGEPGLGKTSLARVLLEGYNYDVCEFNASELRNQKQVREKLAEINGNMNVISFMVSNKRSMGVIMDEIDGMSGNDKGGLTELMNTIFTKRSGKDKRPTGSPFICISNSIDKKIKTLRDKSVSIKFSRPSKMLMTRLIERILKAEGIEVDYFEIGKIITHSQGDYRRLVNLLEYLFYNKSTEEEVLEVYENIDNLLANFEKKSETSTGYDSVSRILNTKMTVNDYFDEYHENPSLVSLLLFENVVNTITKNRKGRNTEKTAVLRDVMTYYSDTDKYETAFYKLQKWDLQNYICSDRLISTMSKVNSLERYSVNRDSSLNYSKMLNKISQEHTHYKLVDFYNVNFTNYHQKSVYHKVAEFIIYSLIYNYENTIKWLKIKGITYDEFEKKICKIVKDSEFINASVRREIKLALVY